MSAQSNDRMYRPPEPVRSGELAFFSGAGFQGRSYFLTGPRSNLSIPFMARSYRVAPSDQWQLCARTEYRQPCVTVSASDADRGIMTGFQVRSHDRSGAAVPGMMNSARAMAGLRCREWRASSSARRKAAVAVSSPAAAARSPPPASRTRRTVSAAVAAMRAAPLTNVRKRSAARHTSPTCFVRGAGLDARACRARGNAVRLLDRDAARYATAIRVGARRALFVRKR